MEFVLIFIAGLVACAIYGRSEYKKSQNAPILTTSVYLVKKYRISSDDSPDRYYGEFALQDGKTLKLDVKVFGYEKLPRSGSCIITYKYKTLLDLKYLGAIDEKHNDSVKENKKRKGRFL